MEIITTERIVRQLSLNQDHKYEVWIELIEKCKPTLRIFLNENSDFYSNDENVAWNFIQAKDLEPKIIKDCKSILSYFSSEQVFDESGIIVGLLDIDSFEAKRIFDQYGIICHTLDQSVAGNLLFDEGIEKSVDKNEPDRGWEEILGNNPIKPSNALIFIDRYMFANDTSNHITFQHGVENVFQVLDRVLPYKFAISYQVLLVFDASTLDNKGDIDFNLIVKNINRIKKRLNRSYNIVIEVVSINKTYLPNYDETHNRRIISNYFLLRLDRSLKAFDNGRSLYSQTIWFDWLASKGIVRQKNSDMPFKAQMKYLKELRKSISTLQAVKDQSVVSFAQNGNTHISIKDLRNRLLK